MLTRTPSVSFRSRGHHPVIALTLVVFCAGALPRQSVAASGAAPTVRCHTRIILSFAPAKSSAPNDKFVAALARAENVQLKFLNRIAPNLFVLGLSAADSDCQAAIERLRGNVKVRSVEIDARRQIRTP
jgi:hypothetical protein